MEPPREPRLPEHPALLILGAGGGAIALLGALARRGLEGVVVDPRGLGWVDGGGGTRLVGLPGRGRREGEGAMELLRSAQHVVRATPVALPLARGESRIQALSVRVRHSLQRLRIVRGEWPSPRQLDGEQRALLLPGLRFGNERSTRALYAALVEGQRLVELRALEARFARAPVLTRTELLGLAPQAAGGSAIATLRDRLDGTTREILVWAIVDASGAWSSRALAALDLPACPAPADRSILGATLPHRVDAAARCLDARGERAWEILPALGGMCVSTRIRREPGQDPDASPDEAEISAVAEFIADAFPGLEESRALCWKIPLDEDREPGPRALRPLGRIAGVSLFRLRAGNIALQARIAREAAARLGAKSRGGKPAESSPRGHLPGGDIATVAGAEASLRALGLEPVQARWMVLRYGSLCEPILEMEGGDSPLGSAGFPLACELAWLYHHEGTRTLSDLLRSWHLPEIVGGFAEERRVVDAILMRMTRLAGWSPARQEREAKRWWRERALRWTTREGAP